MDQKEYQKTTAKEFEGRKVILLRDVHRGSIFLPANIICDIVGKRNGFTLKTAPEFTLGIRVEVDKVKPDQVKLLPKDTRHPSMEANE